TRADFHAAMGVLLVTREPPAAAPPMPGQPALVGANPAEGLEILLAVWDDGSVTALNGHVDLGTGLRTALTQIGAEELHVALDTTTPVKAAADYRIVGASAPRVDIPAKATGELTFVHDLRVPGMLHGRVVRPPYAGADHGDFIGNTLEAVDQSSIAHIPGI